MLRLKTNHILFQIIILAVLFSTDLCRGTAFFVKTNGSNAGNGTNWTQAWKTIGYAATNAFAGDIVTVSNGYYNEEVVIPNSGTSLNSITFQAYQNECSVINGTGRSNGFYLNLKNHIVIRGFMISNTTRYGILMENSCSSNYIINNKLIWNTLGGVLLSASSNNQIQSNILHHNINESGVRLNNGSSKNYITGNTFFSNSANGITVNSDESDSNFILYNLIRHSTFHPISGPAPSHSNVTPGIFVPVSMQGLGPVTTLKEPFALIRGSFVLLLEPSIPAPPVSI